MYSLKIVVFGSKLFAVMGLQSEVRYATSGLRCLYETNSQNLEDVNRSRPELNRVPVTQRIIVMERMTGADAYEVIKNS